MATPTDAEDGNLDQPTSPVVDVVTPATPAIIQLPPGTVLSEAQAMSLAADRTMRIIILAGAVDCGKTTLISSLYELFQSGPVNGVHFAGCHTLPAFEQRCHLSRAESGNQTADTSRTPYEGPHSEYLHLKIQNGDSESTHIDFLFTDVSGEMFEHARNSTDDCKQLSFLRRASHFVVFLDCEKALIINKKWEMVQEVKSLLRSCLDSSMLENTCSVTVVWSKCDFFEAAKDKAAVDKFVKDVESDLKVSFTARIPSLKFHRVAPRPTRFPNLKMGYGVKELFDDWISIWPQGRVMRLEPPIDHNGPRESEQFAKRYSDVNGSV